MEQQRWHMETTMRLSHFALRRGKRGGGGQKEVKDSERVAGNPRRHNMLTTVYSSGNSQRGSAWGRIVRLIWTHLEACQIHFFLLSPIQTTLPKLLLQFHLTFIHPVPITLASEWWGKWRNEKKRTIRTYMFTILPPLLHLPIWYQSSKHSV